MNTAIGLDVSTQGVKAIVLDDNGAISARTAHSFAEPFRPDPDPTVRVCDPLVWLDGANRALRDLSALGVDVAALPIGIAAQQHGTVYTRADGSLSRRLSPIWMDTSAAREADELEHRFGNEMLRRTGSRAQARFAAAQILKFVRTDPAAFAETARIDLVSSYVARHLTGASEIDFCDAAGMNLMNLATGDWDREICDYISKDLVSKLPRISRGLPFTGGRLRRRPSGNGRHLARHKRRLHVRRSGGTHRPPGPWTPLRQSKRRTYGARLHQKRLPRP